MMNETLSPPTCKTTRSSFPSSELPSDTEDDITNLVPIVPQQQQQQQETETNDNNRHHPEDFDAIQNESPLVSVLNVVVDHEMIPPTPLERTEFQQQQQQRTNCRVPVLRIFGPVLRRDSGFCVEPRQSACLYVHGAFPYLLARPVVAGPNGSLHHGSHLKHHSSGISSGHTDWDSVESVRRIIPDLHVSLEAAIQASMNVMNPDDDKDNDNNNQNNARRDHDTQAQGVIRRISIVKGRGFYTYCPGPPAPFLRVEYYDPKLRWRVKLMLERGLDVPQSFHPDPLQYQATLTPPPMDMEKNDIASSMMEPLSFHCYEAHIPYTMQFFKDYNLAGMSYIHLSSAKFRLSVPTSAPCRFDPLDNANDDSAGMPDDALFLEKNTPDENVWNEVDIQLSMDSGIAFLQQSSAEEETACSGEQDRTVNVAPQHVDPFWTRKETSCDLEIDVTVDQILNVKSVMTSLPQNEEERQKTHWRAVPSLREIWRKERQRMQRLLPPKDDFLSHPSESDAPFTLNAKDESTPGARLAAEGMHRLFRPSQGLEEQFQRAMRQIVERHSASVARVDTALRNCSRREPFAPSSLTPTKDELPQQTQISHSPPVDDVVDALGALGGQFAENENNEDSFVPGDSEDDVPALDACEDLSSQFTDNEDDRGRTGDDGTNHTDGYSAPHLEFSQESMSASQSNLLSQQCTQDPHDFSQRVERGDSIAAENVHIEDLIDPNTLTLTEDPEDSDGFLEEEERMTEREFEQALTSLASQTFARSNENCKEAGAADDKSTDDWIQEDTVTQPPHDRIVASGHESDDSLAFDDKAKVDHISRVQEAASFQGRHEAQATSFASTTDKPRTTLTLPHSQSQLLPMESADVLEPRGIAPTRSHTTKRSSCDNVSGEGLYPMGLANGIPEWLHHSTEYEKIRSGLVSVGCLSRTWTVPTDSDIEPVGRAPVRGKVKSWNKRRQNDGEQADSCRPPKSRKTSRETFKAMQQESSDWTVDEQHLHGYPNELLAGKAQEIEEVECELSQKVGLSQPQPDVKPDETYHGSTSHACICQRSPIQASIATRREPRAESSTNASGSETRQTCSDSSPRSFSQSTPNALAGIGQQGGQIFVEGGGGLKAKARSPPRLASRARDQDGTTILYGSDLPSPLTMMSVEVHVQCRFGRAGVSDSKEITMRPNPEKDRIFAVVYVLARDPGGGEALEMLERGCLFVPNHGERDNDQARLTGSIPRMTMGMSSKLTVESVCDEKHLLLRLASIVQWKDPDMLLSWDTQGSGLGYIIERGSVISERQETERISSSGTPSQTPSQIDMARLLGRTPRAKKTEECVRTPPSRSTNQIDSMVGRDELKGELPNSSSVEKRWKGSGLGTEWDDRVGAGAAAASIKGRLVFAGWKIAAEDVKHPNASYLQAIVSTVLNKRIPFHDDLQLTRWYGLRRERWRVLHYRLMQATASLLIFDALDVCGRAGEAAGLSGVEFSQSFSGIRGSQYKVEGVLLRALQSINAEERGTKHGRQGTILSDDSKKLGIDGPSSLSEESKSQTQSPWKMRRRSFVEDKSEAIDCELDGNYFFFSPSLQDCSRQEALECQALTLEPQSGYYDDPVVVCDFTALYPSLMIAYNLCYATCAGKLEYHSTRHEMRRQGRTTGQIGPMRYPEARTATVLKHHMKSLVDETYNDEGSSSVSRSDRAYVAPTGAIFVSEAALRGVLPQVLEEMLTTRAMLKKAAKQYKKCTPNLAPSVLRQLEARQLAIKMISNVMYGYTSATFSGRSAMPLVADSIVECGRRTLSNAINLANAWGKETSGRWRGAEVIYGDTDSLFIRLPGRSIQEAFEFGEAFCKTVTASNPPPVHLKLEKVYKGSIMQTKKKYCGMKYDSIEQKKPTFEAKGIETIRRDQCALTQKVLRNALVALFQSGIQAVKSYLFRQWSLILSGSLPVSDFILTGRVRSRYRGGRVGPVQAVLARRLAEADPGRVVRHKERLAYVIVATPGTTFRLRDCVLTPTELLEQWDAYSIHSTYYITKHVNAALQRCFGLANVNVDVNAWFESCPKPRKRLHFWPVTRSGNNVMISTYFGSDVCSLCGKKCRANGKSRAVVCSACQQDRIDTVQQALKKLNHTQEDAQEIAKACTKCNLCFEDSTTFAPLKAGKAGLTNGALPVNARGSPGIMTPLANCICIDCPSTFERHRLREAELEAVAICHALGVM